MTRLQKLTMTPRRIIAQQSADKSHGASWRAWLPVFDQLVAESKDTHDLIEISRDGARSRLDRSVAVWALGELGSRTAAEPLLGLLKARDSAISWHAANALCSIGDERVVPKLLKIATTSPYVHAREGAVWILHKIRNPDAVPTLVKVALQDRIPSVRHSATHSLISYPCKRTFKALATALNDPSACVRFGAVFAVSCSAEKRGIEVTIPALEKLIRDKADVQAYRTITQDARDALSAILSYAAERKHLKKTSEANGRTPWTDRAKAEKPKDQ